jgi:hypothetical protein
VRGFRARAKERGEDLSTQAPGGWGGVGSKITEERVRPDREWFGESYPGSIPEPETRSDKHGMGVRRTLAALRTHVKNITIETERSVRACRRRRRVAERSAIGAGV